ncbi:MAG TPA: tetratricopeptide repeat protein [Tepidisphaeraceae bacterium]|jgi:Flp pilus assembly protein TadD|nr:tetratricopeptide repeat protein [Tepidisphaeraceae bacterium]
MTVSRHARCAGAAALVALTLIVYIPVIRTGGFIWDDPQYITGNPLLRTIPGLGAIWIHPSASPQYYPLVYTTFWIEYHLVGLRPWLYHLDNILLHALASILLWLALRRLHIPAAGLAAAIFAVHPVNVESVAWATERKNVLSLVFYLLSLHAYLNFTGDDLRAPRSGLKYYLLALILFIAALLSKSVACSLPAAILLLIYWRHGRLRWGDLVPLIPFFAFGLTMACITAGIERHHVGASGSEWNFSFADRCLIAGRALWFYAEKLFWPHPLVFIYPRWERMAFSLRPWLIVFPLSAVTTLAALWLLRRRIGRGPLVAVLFFAGTLLPALGFVNLYPMRYSFVADHFQYQAGIGLIVLAAAGLWRLGHIPSAAVIVILAILTWRRGPIYQNQLVLWKDTTEHNPTSWMAWGNLGDEYAGLSNRPGLPAAARDEDRAKARACYQRLYSLAPDQPLAHLKWGIVLEYDGDLTDARAEFQQALNLAPKFTIAMNSMGMLLIQLNEPDEATKYYRKAIELDPGYAEVRVNYGNVLLSRGDVDAAMAQYAEAAARRPDNVEAQFKYANLLFTHYIRPDLAIPHYIAALSSDPSRADIHASLAAAFLATGRFDEAREQCAQALQIDPHLPQAQQLWIRLGH